MPEEVIVENQDPVTPVEESTTISDEALSEMIGNAVDSKLAPVVEKLNAITMPPDMSEFRTSLLAEIRGMIPAESKGIDESSLLGKIDNVITSRLGSMASVTGRTPGVISRWLGLGGNSS